MSTNLLHEHVYHHTTAEWNQQALHLIAHPISPADWYHLQFLQDTGYSPTQAVSALALTPA